MSRAIELLSLLERDQFGGMSKKEKSEFFKYAKNLVLKDALSDFKNGTADVGSSLDHLDKRMTLAVEDFLEYSPVKFSKEKVYHRSFRSAVIDEVAKELGDLINIHVKDVSPIGDRVLIFPKALKLDTAIKKASKMNNKFNQIENPDSEVFQNLIKVFKKLM